MSEFTLAEIVGSEVVEARSHEAKASLAVHFPVHFHHVSVETGAKERCNTEEVRYELRRAITYFRENKDETDWHTWSGNLFVFVHRWSGDENYEVVVSKDFYNMEIDFEDKDYERKRDESK